LYSDHILAKMLMERGYSRPQSLGRDKLASGSHLSAWGGSMRKFLIVMVATMCLGISLAGTVQAQDSDYKLLQQQLIAQQKRERDALKAQQQSIKQSWKTKPVSGAYRAEATHQMQRDRRNLLQKQKDARQDLKDRQRAWQENQRNYGH